MDSYKSTHPSSFFSPQTPIRNILCFALIHNRITLTFPFNHFMQICPQNNANKRNVSLKLFIETEPMIWSLISFKTTIQMLILKLFWKLGWLHSFYVLKINAKRLALLLCVLFSTNSSKCWELFINVTMINNDWCCNYRP